MVVGQRVTSGIHGLDKIISGGFKKNSVNLVAGNPGSGKTIFAMQFLLEGLKKGESCLFITFDETKEKLLADFSEMNWELERFERMGTLKILEYTPEQLRQLIAEGGGTLDSLVSQLKAQRIVVDSISSYGLIFSSEITKHESSLAFFDLLQRWDCTAVMTSNQVEGTGDTLTVSSDFEADSVTMLYHYKKKGTRERALEVVKMRGTKTPEKIMKMTLDNKGVTVDPKKIVSL